LSKVNDPMVFVIIVTYNGMKWLPNCLESLANSTLPSTIVVIDNNSTDATVSYIKEHRKNVVLFEQPTNLGFGAANNIGMHYALQHNPDYVFLLNQDTKLEADAIEKLIAVASRNPEYGILSPIQLDYSGDLLEDCFYFFMAEQADKSFYSDAVLGKDLKEIYELRFVQAASWLLPKNTLLTVGGFDPIFYHYGEDNNYCYRTLYHGLKIGVCPGTYVRHDSTAKLAVEAPLFSEKYFKDYQLSILHKYCNISMNLGEQEILFEIRKNQISSFKALLKCNLVQFKGYSKKAMILKNYKESILLSRKNNLEKRANYL